MPDPILRAESKLIRRAFTHSIQYHHDAPTVQDYRDITEWTWACAFRRIIQDIRTEYGINPWDEETSLRDRLTDADLQTIMDAESLMVTVFDAEEPRTTEDFARLINETLAPDIEIPTAYPHWPPVVENKPILANWRQLYDKQYKRLNTAFVIPKTWWKNYATTETPNITATYNVSWLYWSQAAQKLYIYGGLLSTPVGVRGTALFTATGAVGISTAEMGVTIRNNYEYDAKPILAAGTVSQINKATAQAGDAICQMTANKSPVTWDIVSGNPTNGTAVGFTIDAAGLVRVSEPRLFTGDPFIINNTYVLTIRATDSAGVYGFLDVSVPVQ